MLSFDNKDAYLDQYTEKLDARGFLEPLKVQKCAASLFVTFRVVRANTVEEHLQIVQTCETTGLMRNRAAHNEI